MSDHIFIYRLTSDTGCAPCIYKLDEKENYVPTSLLTLACCKGGYFKKKKDGNKIAVNSGLRYEIGKKYINKIKNNQDTIWSVFIKIVLFILHILTK